jgi:hypothetical protein
MKLLTRHEINDGKWRVQVWLKEDEPYTHIAGQRQELRAAVELFYNASPELMAKSLLENILDAVRVEAETFGGPAIIAER